MESDIVSLLLIFVPLLLIAGAAAGMLAGMLGVGGGIVIVPALYHIFSYLEVDDTVRMHVAVGTSLATIIPTSIRSVRAHQARGSFDAQLFRRWATGIIVGVLVGTWVATLVNFATLALIFAGVALLVSAYMALGNPAWRLAEGLPGPLLNQPIAGCVGALSALMGIGGGTIAVPVLSLCGIPIHRSIGTAAGFGLIIAVPGTVGFMLGGMGTAALPAFSVGYVNWLAFIIIAPMTVLMVPLGAKLAHSLSQTALRRVFALFLGLTALRMLMDIVRF